MIKAAIFDMDGLLIDSEPIWRQSHVAVLARHGHEITVEDVRVMAGRRPLDVVTAWHDRFGWEDPSIVEMSQIIQDEVAGQVDLNGEALPGVYEIIGLLQSRGIPMSVASSSSLPLIEAVMRKLRLGEYMEHVVSGEHEKRGKPFPDVFLTAARKHGVSPADCLVFEDSLNGVKAAKAAGMKCIAVPEHPHNPAAFVIADAIVGSLDEVDWPLIESLWA